MVNCRTSSTIAGSRGNTVVVLPEYGLTGPTFPTRESLRPFLEKVPDPAEAAIPCNNTSWDIESPALAIASCLAMRCGMDVVIDIPEGALCSPTDPGCPVDGAWHYNTQVALRGSDGAVVGRYRKQHLYFEPAFDVPTDQSPQTFVSSFGVQFGMLICFDIMFDWPASGLLGAGVRNVVYSTWWVNMPPFLTATQVQAGWANRSQVNLIAAGSGEEGWRSSGSGVYAFAPASAPSAAQWVHADSMAPQSKAVWMDVTDSKTFTHGLNLRARPVGLAMSPVEDTEATQPWQLNVSAFPANMTIWQASTAHVTCIVEAVLVPDSREARGSSGFAVVAAEGWYNGLFPTVMCGFMVCPSGNSSCFIEDGSRFGYGAFHHLSAAMTVCNTTEQPAGRWRLFANGAHGGMQAVLPSTSFSMLDWQSLAPSCATASARLGKPDDELLDVLLYGIDKQTRP